MIIEIVKAPIMPIMDNSGFLMTFSSPLEVRKRIDELLLRRIFAAIKTLKNLFDIIRSRIFSSSDNNSNKMIKGSAGVTKDTSGVTGKASTVPWGLF